MKQKGNWWLSDRHYIDNTSYKDKLYLHELGNEIREYIYKAPIPIVCEWKDDKHAILFEIGKDNNNLIKVSADISSKDFVTLIESWSKNFYPQYTVEVAVKTPLSKEEKVEGIKRGLFNLDESFNQYLEEKIKEIGVITRVFILEDKFTISVNGKKQVRLTGNYSTPLPISIFLKNLRNIKDSIEKKAYIFNYSTPQNVNVKDKEIVINYIGKKLLNFFKINKQELSNYPFLCQEDGYVKLGRFVINTRNSESIIQQAQEIIYSKEINNGII